MNYETIEFQLDAGIARLTLNRPERLNSFTVAMHGEVRDALSRVTAASGARVLVLTGAGRGFCAGQDLNDRAVAPGGAGVDLGESIEKYYGPLILALRNLPMPVIAAVNGVAAGAGANIAIACDIVIAARSASFVQAFCKLGLVPDSGGTWSLPRLVGPARAMGLALTGEKLSAEQAAAWGLIWRVVDDEALRCCDRSTCGAVRSRADARARAHETGAVRRVAERSRSPARSRARLPARARHERGLSRGSTRLHREAGARVHRPMTEK